MTDRYFDWDLGSDSNDGLTTSTPKKTYSPSGISAGDRILFRRGTTQIVTTQYQTFPNGSSHGVRTYVGVYGEGQVDWAGFRAGHAFGDMIINGSRKRYQTIENIRFDATGVNQAMYCAAQGASNETFDQEFNSCEFANSNANGLNIQQEGTSTTQPSDFRLNHCVFRNNKAHGLAVTGVLGARITNSVFSGNAFDSSYGGHGFSARVSRTEPTGGWSAAGGGVYSRALGAAETTVYYVRNAAATETRMTQNTGTPTTPSSGEWGQSGTTLYVNVGGADPGSNVSYAWGLCSGIVLAGCEAYDNYWDRDYIYHEGHGFAFDDWTQDSAFIGCRSYRNQGLGFSFNRGDNNVMTGCLAYDNWRAALAINGSGRNSKVYNCTFVNNTSGEGPLTTEVSVAGSCNGTLIKNCIINGSSAYGINFDSSASGCESAYNAISGFSDAVLNGTESNTVTADPLLDASYRPLSGSPCIGAGTYIAGVRDFAGRKLKRTPDIGAKQYYAPRGAVTALRGNVPSLRGGVLSSRSAVRNRTSLG